MVHLNRAQNTEEASAKAMELGEIIELDIEYIKDLTNESKQSNGNN